ncbi:tyrosine-type recombinase/integrase [Haloferax sp. DFSO60]|uniref:tyrosine-type recombinase/integrase n=1 Tax=Haloferax sp. DFSO60 TaxID=3388652 RepID=UPI00397C93D9
MTNDLEPLEPAAAKQMYLDARSQELSDATLQSHHYRLKQFVQWCEEEAIDNMNTFSGREIHRYRVKRRNEDGLSNASMKGQLATLRVFLRFCASIDAVEPGLDEKILLPTTTSDDARTESLSSERAWQILAHLEKYHYARLEHVLLEVLWHTGLRIGAAVSLDVDDFDSEERFFQLVHRPEQGTSLKNGKESERYIALSERVCGVLDDWLKVNHPGTVDEYSRKPLFATRQNRLSRNRGRTISYQYTRPCVYDSTCPHDRDIDECDARPSPRAYACPSSLSPHPIRRGAITYYLQQDTPERVVSDRMDVGTDVLDRHYDQRTEREKLRQRRRYLPEDERG